MKRKILFTAIICFLIIEIQEGYSQIPFDQQNPGFDTYSEFGILEPFSSKTPMNNNDNIFLRSNEWGGGGDAPDPEEDLATGGESLPIGDGVFVMIGFAIFFSLIKTIAKGYRFQYRRITGIIFRCRNFQKYFLKYHQ